MKILINSKISQDSIKVSLGKPEYSYYFLLKEFLPALEQAGDVIVVVSIEEAEQRYRQLAGNGEEVVLISVSPPHQTPLHLQCPTVTLFAWEFDTLPDTVWGDNPGNDWRHVFANTAGAICTSREAADLVRQAAGPDFPVIALPAPVWNRYSPLAAADGNRPNLSKRRFRFAGSMIDSPRLGLSADGLVSPPLPSAPAATESGIEAAPAMATAHATQQIGSLPRQWLRKIRRLASSLRNGNSDAPAGVILVNRPRALQVSDVVFTTLLNPADSRKNWTDIVTAFCWAFKEQPNATLVVKMTHHDLEHYRVVLITLLSRLSPFTCRVVVLHGFLDDDQYADLIRATTFYVNASSGEGLCLPLMEFLSAGVPAIAPTHTAMADYIDDTLAFTVRCSLEPFCWPHDPSGIFTTHRHRLNWQSLMEAFRTAYTTAVDEPEHYRRMSRAAGERMHASASVQSVSTQLRDFLASVTDTAAVVQRKAAGHGVRSR